MCGRISGGRVSGRSLALIPALNAERSIGVVIGDGNKTAEVMIRTKVLFLMPGVGAQVFEMPSRTYCFSTRSPSKISTCHRFL